MTAPAVGSPVTVLLVDDDDTFRKVMGSELERRGLKVVPAASGEEALSLYGSSAPDVVLLDLRLPDMDGIEVLKRLREQHHTQGVIMLTGHGTIDTAIQAMRLGAEDYLEKPSPVAKVEMAIQKILKHRHLLARHRVLKDGYQPADVAPRFVGRSEAFQQLCRSVERIAQTDATTLVLGETGSGKDMVARLLHASSPRRESPFVVVDCAALHEELLQSELFGHEKGAFTGAARLKHGLFEVAHEGTLFLDEVGDTSPETQARLLRVLETGRFRRVGGTEEVEVDVRIVSATNRDLRRAVARQRFREDLFFRLSTVTVEVPPLRDRREDISLLLEHFTHRLNQRFSTSARLGPEALQALVDHSWPGNVRELIHVLEQVLLLAEHETVERADLPPEVLGSAGGTARGTPGVGEHLISLKELERQHVLSVLERLGGKRAQAAKVLGISERNLYRLLNRYGHAERPDS